MREPHRISREYIRARLVNQLAIYNTSPKRHSRLSCLDSINPTHFSSALKNGGQDLRFQCARVNYVQGAWYSIRGHTCQNEGGRAQIGSLDLGHASFRTDSGYGCESDPISSSVTFLCNSKLFNTHRTTTASSCTNLVRSCVTSCASTDRRVRLSQVQKTYRSMRSSSRRCLLRPSILRLMSLR